MLGQRSQWGLFADEVGGTYKSRNNGTGDGIRLMVPDGPWRIVYTHFRMTQDQTFTTHTVMTACYVAAGNLRFEINSETLLSRAAHLLGMSDIRVGDAEFDAAFAVQGNEPAKVKELLADAELRRLLLRQPKVHVTIFDEEGFITRNFRTTADTIFGDTRDDTIKLDNVNELYFHFPIPIDSFDQVMDLFSLFKALLRRLVAIGAAAEIDPTSLASPQVKE